MSEAIAVWHRTSGTANNITSLLNIIVLLQNIMRCEDEVEWMGRYPFPLENHADGWAPTWIAMKTHLRLLLQHRRETRECPASG
jgi:hypothetical protein